jgi:hypothetical protein
MHPLAEIQELEDGDPGLTVEEQKRIREFKIPGDVSGKQSFGVRHYPRKPKENPGKWFADHAAKLRSLIRASK